MRTISVFILLVLLFFPAFTNAAQFSNSPLDSVIYHSSASILSQGYPYSITIFNCLAYTGNDIGPLAWFDITDSVEMEFIDSIGLYDSTAYWHKNMINQYFVDSEYKRYLFQGVLGGLLVYDITDSSVVTLAEFGPFAFWVQDVYVYDTVVLCSANGPWFTGGLYIYDFSPSSETLTLDTILLDGNCCFQSMRNSDYIYSLRKQPSYNRLIVDVFSTADYSLLAADTSDSQLTIDNFTNDNHSMMVVADSFTMVLTVFDTLVFVPIFDSVGEHPYPRPGFPNDTIMGTTYDIDLWLIDYDTGGLTSSYKTVAQSMDINGKEMTPYDTKYSNSHLFVSTCKAHLYAFDVADTSNIFIADSIIGYDVNDMAIRPNLDGSQDILFADQNAISGTSYTVLYRFNFDANEGAYIAGDYNGDNNVNVSDALQISYYVSGSPSAYAPVPLGRGDVNGDGYLSVNDFFYLYYYIFSGGPAPRCNCVD